MIAKNHQLTPQQLHDLVQLTESCQIFDKGAPTIYYNLLQKRRSHPVNLLAYEKDKLIGFLSVYFFYDDACEISLLVAPNRRRQGIAKNLLKTLLPLLELNNFVKVIFSSPSSFDHNWFPQKNLSYFQSEYHMKRSVYEPIFLPNQRLKIRHAHAADIDQLCNIDEACFNTNKLLMSERFYELLNDNNYTLLIAEFENKLIGKAHIHWEENQAVLSDIAILPSYQKKGLGGELLGACINEALSLGQNTIELDVETKNKHALNLYNKYGFQTIKTIDFWSILTKKLRAIL